MQTRSSSRLVSNPSSNPTPSTNPNSKGRNRGRSKQRIEEFNLEELSPPIVMMADQRTMAQLLQAPTEGYEDAIVVPAITADNFELKHGLLTLVQNKQFFEHDKEDPHAHIRYFNKMTSTLKFSNCFDESFSEAWDRFKDLLRACPHHGFLKLHQLDTFYNALNLKDQDSLNSAAGGNFLDKMPRECLAIIESKSKVCYSHNKPVVAKLSMNTSTSGISPDVAELKDMVKELFLDKKSQNQAPATVKAVEESCVTCGGAHSYRNCPATDSNIYRDNIQEFVSQASVVNYNQGNTSYRPSMMSNQIRPPGFPPIPNNQNVQLNQRNNQNCFNQNQNRENNFKHGPVYQPPVFQAPAYQALAPQTQGVSKQDSLAYVKLMMHASTSCSGTLPSNTIANPRSDLKAITTRSEATKDTVHPTNNESTEDVQPSNVHSETPILTSEPVKSLTIELVASPVNALRPNQRPSIPYPSRLQDQKLRDKANDQRKKFFQIFNDLNFNISFADAFILIPKFGPSIKSLLTNKDKLCELTRTPLNKHLSTVLLNKLPKKLGDPGKFLIPCDFPGKAECLALADLGASINLMPLSMWNKVSLPDLSPTCLTLELVDRSISRSVRVAKDVYVKVGTFHFPADFVVEDFDADPRVPLILWRSFLKIGRALIDVFEGELTLHVGKEAITFNLDQTLRYSANYNDMTAKRIEVIDMACEDDFILEEVDAFLALEDDPTSPKGDILLLEAFLNDDPSLPPPNQGNYLPEVELKDLPPHLEYAFLEGDDKLPVIIAKDLSVEEKTALITVLKSHKRAIAWKLFDIKDSEPAVQHQRRVNPKIHDVIKQEVIKFLDAGLIYLTSDSPWVSPVHCVPKKDGFTVVENKENELIPTRLVMGWPVYIDYFFENSFQSCLSHLEKMLKRCEDTNLCLNWEKSHVMVKEECVEAFQTLKRKQIEAPILTAPDWDMPFELMCDASDFAIGAWTRNEGLRLFDWGPR
uniref:Reverse transcriptase domain-containing protein n=1 Tax=Tanacetum cinerariifolium TaxID=118510 RepID=A0A6L2KNH6_TANCI|nr:reverse transcriptase domain-containing protein [Tanacetum cinerariifolium]